jgi:hypothetical protein
VSKPYTPILSPAYSAELHKDDFIAHPETEQQSYGFVPKMESRGIILPAGHIHLRAGRHISHNKGFGVNHIWGQHGHELPKWGCKSIDEVAAYVAAVIVHQARIYCEFHLTKNGYRVTILRSAKGFVVLEPILDQQCELEFYSVVTAYRLGRHAHGTEVGKVICNVK